MPISLPPFDPSRDFNVANTSFRASGLIWLRKRPFDKNVVNERVLRQLYEARKIDYAPVMPDLTRFIGPLLERFVAAVRQTANRTTGTAAAAEVVPVRAEAVIAPDGDVGTVTAAAAARRERIDRLMIDHSHTQLVTKAESIPGITRRTPKAKVAEALIDAGLAG